MRPKPLRHLFILSAIRTTRESVTVERTEAFASVQSHRVCPVLVPKQQVNHMQAVAAKIGIFSSASELTKASFAEDDTGATPTKTPI